ncbi:hypothetical protein CXB51_035386 [Gossypium anomalum]|uniref:Protein kinase domain-containing protein n=1 Tax=Gossypium anomalum TaxID=47600 RepID=A0A8J6CJG8_9ROSI|nr:hypothetical protein CXB51_035386 [Gossypium anomalum]
MWGYLPGALPQRAPLASPVLVRIPDSIDHSWTDVCGGGCGFAMAISDMWAVGAILAELFPSSPIFPGERLEDMKDQLRKRMFTKRVVRRIFMAHVGYRLLTFVFDPVGHYTIPKEMNKVCNWLTARLGLER